MELRKLRESEQRRKDIIKGVRALIKAGGAREITLRKVAEMAGFSTTVAYEFPEQGQADYPSDGQ